VTSAVKGKLLKADSSDIILSFPRKRWFDRPFDRLTVLSDVEGLTTLSEVEGESR